MLPTSFESASTILDAGKTATSRVCRKVANNTWLIRSENGDIGLRLHTTSVVIYHTDGSITLNSGGWQTLTTKARMSEGSPFQVSSIRGEWFVAGLGMSTRFFDGIRIAADGTVLNASPKDLDEMARRDTETHKLIGRYLKGLTVEILNELVIDANENGLGGDCWMCNLHTVEGKSMGDASGDVEHLRSHLEERYYMLSLILNALKESGYRNPEVIIQMGVLNSIKRSLRAYFVSRLMENREGRRGNIAIAGVGYEYCGIGAA